jgi:hypothetical protein
MDADQAAPQPGVAEGRIQCEGVVKLLARLPGLAFRRQRESVEGVGLGVSGSQGEAFVQVREGLFGAPEAEFEFRGAFSGKAKLG